jgi:hypothetical protein
VPPSTAFDLVLTQTQSTSKVGTDWHICVGVCFVALPAILRVLHCQAEHGVSLQPYVSHCLATIVLLPLLLLLRPLGVRIQEGVHQQAGL